MALPHQLISTAFVREREEVRVGLVVDEADGYITVRTPHGEEWRAVPAAADVLAETLRRGDVTRAEGSPVVLFHRRRGLLAVLTGPSTPPAQLRIVAAVDLASDVPTVVLGDEEQTWLVFETSPFEASPTETTPTGATPA